MSLVAELHNAHKARLAAIAAKAMDHEGSKRAALVAELKECCAPEPTEDVWVEQQTQKHKQPFFSIISATKLTPTGRPTIRAIQRATCDVYGVKMHDLLSARRTWDIVLPRHVSMYLARELTSLSLPRIARATGDRDHTCAFHAHRKIERLLKSDEELTAKVAEIRGMLA